MARPHARNRGQVGGGLGDAATRRKAVEEARWESLLKEAYAMNSAFDAQKRAEDIATKRQKARMANQQFATPGLATTRTRKAATKAARQATPKPASRAPKTIVMGAPKPVSPKEAMARMAGVRQPAA